MSDEPHSETVTPPTDDVWHRLGQMLAERYRDDFPWIWNAQAQGYYYDELGDRGQIDFYSPSELVICDMLKFSTTHGKATARALKHYKEELVGTGEAPLSVTDLGCGAGSGMLAVWATLAEYGTPSTWRYVGIDHHPYALHVLKHTMNAFGYDLKSYPPRLSRPGRAFTLGQALSLRQASSPPGEEQGDLDGCSELVLASHVFNQDAVTDETANGWAKTLLRNQNFSGGLRVLSIEPRNLDRGRLRVFVTTFEQHGRWVKRLGPVNLPIVHQFGQPTEPITWKGGPPSSVDCYLFEVGAQGSRG